MIQPTLTTERLSLRPFVPCDSRDVQHLAGDEQIADVTADIPHPYPDGLAESWIVSHQPAWERGERASFAITNTASGELMGAISLMHIENGQAELGYWLGVDYWGAGYATEACMEILRFAEQELKLHKVVARVLQRNPASAKVLLKAGMQYTGDGQSGCGYRNNVEPIALYEISF